MMEQRVGKVMDKKERVLKGNCDRNEMDQVIYLLNKKKYLGAKRGF